VIDLRRRFKAFTLILLACASLAGTSDAFTQTLESTKVIKLQTNLVSDGAHARISLTVTNLTGLTLDFPSHVFLNVTKAGGIEAPTTLLQRQMTGQRREHDAPLIETGGYEPPIEPGASFTRYYNVADYYDLSQSGDYRLRLVAFSTVAVVEGKLSLNPRPGPTPSNVLIIHVH
jgi:hypothetical protein